MKVYSYLKYSDDFKICYDSDSLYDKEGKNIASINDPIDYML